MFQADVLVNSTDPKLEHKHANVSRALMGKAGSKLRDQCHESYPNGIEDRLLAVTKTPWVDDWKEVYHIALPQEFWENEVCLKKGKVFIYVCRKEIKSSCNQHVSPRWLHRTGVH